MHFLINELPAHFSLRQRTRRSKIDSFFVKNGESYLQPAAADY